MRFLQRVFVFVLQFGFVLACFIGGCIAYELYERGTPYADTIYFREDLHLIVKGSLVATGVIFFVLICYRMTRASLQSGDKDTDIPL